MHKEAWLVLLALNLTSGCDAIGGQAGSESKPGGAQPSPTQPSATATATASNAPSLDLSVARSKFLVELGRAVDAVEKSAKTKTPCPQSVAGEIHAYSLAYANHLAHAKPLSKTAREMTAFRPPWHKLLEGSPVLDDQAAAKNLQQVFDVKHVAIVAPEKLVLPTVEDEKSFLTGELDGWLHVVDLTAAKVACSAPLAFLSGEKVEWTESLSPEQAAQRFDIDKSDAAFHVRVDFFIHGYAALTQTLKDIAPALTLELRGKR